MPSIKVSELAYVRLRLPDLAIAEKFLTDFGLLVSERASDRLYLRGSDPDHHCYIVEQGEAHLLGFAFWAKSEADLEALARAQGTLVEAIEEPGGGKRVRLLEPNGYTVEIVHGIARADPIAVARQLVNTGTSPYLRAGEALRLTSGNATPVKRLAHIVLGSTDVAATARWFQDTLGLITSDAVYTEIGGPQIGAFMLSLWVETDTPEDPPMLDIHRMRELPPWLGDQGDAMLLTGNHRISFDGPDHASGAVYCHVMIDDDFERQDGRWFFR